jgi:FtsZ-binding cell division protein ZapB
MTDDLVQRLRVGDYYPDGDIGYHEISPGKVDALCEQAAERIEAQAAEIERLNKSAECLAETRRLAVKDVAELEAENERLREVSEFYAGWGVTNPVYDTVVILDGGKKARAALEQSK